MSYSLTYPIHVCLTFIAIDDMHCVILHCHVLTSALLLIADVQLPVLLVFAPTHLTVSLTF